MTYIIENKSENILLACWESDFQYSVDSVPFVFDLWDALDQQPQPVTLIIDFGLPALNIGEIFHCVKTLYSGDESVHRHAQLRNMIWVTKSPMLLRAAEELDIRLAEDLDQALRMAQAGV